MKAQNEIRAMNKDLLKHTVGLVPDWYATGMMDRRHAPNRGKLLANGQDV